MKLAIRAGACMLAVAAATGAGVAAEAASGPPPPPTAASGQTVSQVAAGLHIPTSFAFGAGQVFEGDGGAETAKPPNGGVFRLAGGSATKLAGSPQFVDGVSFHGDALYVAGGSFAANGKASWQIQRWSGWNGSQFATRKAIYTAPKGFDGFNGLGFGADGLLYVGIDLGITDNNDHGPANATPYLYDMLTMTTAGKHVSVFASGIRQPYQMAFTAGSNDPYVTDLGQDKGMKKPLDAVLHLRKGQRYGFPRCAPGDGAACKGYARPYKTFAPHTDPMGIAIYKGRIYMSEFGAVGKPLVVSFPVGGGKPTTVLSGFAAPIVGLAIHAGELYVGSLTGQVFAVKL